MHSFVGYEMSFIGSLSDFVESQHSHAVFEIKYEFAL